MSGIQSRFAAGVFKVDFKSAGYKDLVIIANERKKDEAFYEIIVRKVSPENYGLQFVYIDTNSSEDKMAAYKKELHDKFEN